ncbi:MAG: metallophosphoesterase, partial [Bacteroidota bacterium]|nr:metallophosphoesterase [Bacteroidota bacterium]
NDKLDKEPKNKGLKKEIVSSISFISDILGIGSKEDVLFFLGDYIDRGPSSSGVIDYLLKLKRKNYNIYTLRGNHEESILKASAEYPKKEFYKYLKRILKSEDLLNKKKKLKKRYKKFFKQTDFFYELEDFFLVHAGFNFKKKNFLEDKISMLELRSWEFTLKKTKGKKIIHGHRPTHYKKIKKAIKKNNRIPLDNGCVFNKKHKHYDHTQLGKLCCLNLDKLELICQKNVD